MPAPLRAVLLLSSLLSAALLAGCSASQGAGGQEASAAGSLAYQGAATGQHTSSFECGDGQGMVSFGGQIGSGSVTVTIRDAAGATVYTRSFSGPGQSADSRQVEGSGGEWTMSASRSEGSSMYGGGWSGQYGINVEC
jgi:hypothetical protein